jgi:hypothetical protein
MKQFFNQTLFIALLASIPMLVSAQKKTEYLASNGKTYRIGDTVILNRGSSPMGNFMYVQFGGWGKLLTHDSGKGVEQDDLGRAYAGVGAVIKKIRNEKFRGIDRIVFTVGLGTITNCDMFIEDAIATCEIKDCKGKADQGVNTGTQISNADELAKYKKLLDQGAISKADYEAMKKKLLGL